MEVLLSHRSVSPMPGTRPHEQQAQIGVMVALRFSFFSFCCKGFFWEFLLLLVVVSKLYGTEQ